MISSVGNPQCLSDNCKFLPACFFLTHDAELHPLDSHQLINSAAFCTSIITRLLLVKPAIFGEKD